MADLRELKMDFTLKELTLSCHEDADIPGSSSSVELKDKKLVCVEYPAVVTSADKMLETLGGEKAVSKTFAHPNRRLELRYRPQDPFCHPLCGNRFPSSNLVLRVRRRVRKKDPKDAEIHMDILGVIGTTYKFQGMADFQCLAVHSEGGKDTSLYDKIILRKSENQEFFEKPVPLFLPPAIFSRLDCPVDYYYRPDVYQKSLHEFGNNRNFIGLNRARRPHNAIFVSFTEPTVPTECLEAAKANWARISVKESDRQAEEQLRKMFESRPIWSRNAVKANINIHPDKLKLLLPVFAYYMVTGPWRSLWVKLGYDPRKDRDAKQYQLLDFRIRCSTKHGYSIADMPVKAKRSALNYSLPITFNKSGPQAASVMELPAKEGPSISRDPVQVSYQLKEASYIFREGMLPPHRQMFYQLCDLDVESIKQVIEQKGDEQVCDERDGWCRLGTTDNLRDMISAMIKKVIRAQKPALPVFPKKRRRISLISKDPGRDLDPEEEVQDDDDKEDEEEEDEDDEFLPSEGSENEMETEILDYIVVMMVKLGILVAVAVFLETVSAASLGVVYTEGGMVEGKSIRVGLFRRMDVFKGIPFADIPGRFEKPKRHPGWDGVLKATKYRQRCIQVNLLMSDTRGSEDCLYLNIWVPHGSKVSTDLPVMVWIYGGGFLTGGSMGANFLDNYLYNGQEIADRGNVIVVTLGYRVGTMGFLSTGDSDLPGNYGLWDQHAAIGWVKRNIRSFGGDPDNITIFGESAGAASVSFQTLTPHNKGLFKRAISQSGVALCPWAINKNPRRFAEEVAIKVNCPTDQNMASCLKMTDPALLTLAGSLSLSSSPDHPLVWNLFLSPVIDGDFLPDEPSKLFHNAAAIDYIAGVNDMDGHLFTGLDVPSINSPLVDTPIDDVKRLLASYTKEKGNAGLDNAYSTYTSTWGSNPSSETIKKTVVQIGTDYIFLVPTQAALYLHAANATTGRTYSYLFSQPNRLGGIGRPLPGWMGADHADDLQYVFGKPFATPLGYWPRHRDVSGYMIAYWTNFAKTGDPNKGEKVPVTWPAFTSTGHQFLEINSKMDKNYVGQKLRMRYVHFWSSVLPNLPISYSE